MCDVLRNLLRRKTGLFLSLVFVLVLYLNGTAEAIPVNTDDFTVITQRNFSGIVTKTENFGYISNINEIKNGSKISGNYTFAKDNNNANNWYFELKLDLVGSSGTHSSVTWEGPVCHDWGSLILSPTNFHYNWNNGFGMGGLQDAYFGHLDYISYDAGYLSLDVYDYIYKSLYGNGFLTFFDRNTNWNGSDEYHYPPFQDSWDDQPDDGYLSGVKLYFDIAPVSTPEPSTFILSAVGIVGLGLLRRRFCV